ncbi:reverse transcriptase domain-containing protein [Tanacetum coccineum]
MKHSYSNDDTCFSIDVIDEILEEDFDALLDESSKILHSIERTILEEKLFAEFDEFMAMNTDENSESESDTEEPPFKKITFNPNYKIKTSLEEPRMDLELKRLPDNLKYVFLEEPSFLPVIISSQLSEEDKNKLVSFYSPWVSPIHCVPKKGGITVVTNERNELVPTRTVTGWRRCEDAHLVLNWEKCHFMVKEGIVLGYKVPEAGLEVDKAKIEVISKLPPPTNIKECHNAFELLKEKLTCAPVIVSPNWSLPFELMCDANDFAVEAILGQKEDVVFAFDKSRSYLVLSKTIVHTDHSALRHLFKKQDAKPRLIRWILLLQEFDIEIKDRKGIENVAADHLSRIENEETSDDSEVDDNFPRETLMEINTKDDPWFADFANYLKLLCGFGMAKALINDRGTYFCNKIMKRYGVNQRFSTSYHPQTSGQVENTNSALKRILDKTVKDNHAIWSRKLDDALWAFRTAYKTPTDTTPYKLIYGKNCHLPFEIKHHAYWALKNCNPDLIAAGEKRMFQLH